jgi:hypothetical protein
VAASTAGASGPIIGKVRGVFVRSAYDGTLDQAGLKKYIKTPREPGTRPGGSEAPLPPARIMPQRR